MHPNSIHKFIPFVEEMENPENLKKIIEESNHFEDFNKNDKLFKIYNRNQALQRQWVDESREFHFLKDKLGAEMPYTTLGGFKRARRAKSEKYVFLHNDIVELGKAKNDKKILDFYEKKGIII